MLPTSRQGSLPSLLRRRLGRFQEPLGFGPGPQAGLVPKRRRDPHLDLDEERGILFDAPLVSSPELGVETRVDFGLWLVAVGGAPRRTVNLASGEVREHALPAGFAPLDAQFCTAAPSLLPGGDFALLLRGPERTGAYVLDFLGEAAPRPVGQRLRDVSFGSVQPAGSLFAITATT